jgi:ABC-type nitrate/sulfonate/bicarbonate transport system substrate-binding protein
LQLSDVTSAIGVPVGRRQFAVAVMGLAAVIAALTIVLFPALSRRAVGGELLPLVVYAEPDVDADSLWMAEAKGLFKDEGLDVQIRLFPSGTTAFQTFKTGAGDIIYSGDLPALQYWQRGNSYRVIAPSERDSKGYIGVALNAIASPKDLIGKTIATRVGSTGSWFVSEYLSKNGIGESQVTVKNLDPPLMPPAICRGDIDAFFVWQPTPGKALEICGDKVHFLTTAEGYIKGYSVIGARAEWLATPDGADKARRFLRAVRKGAEIAVGDFPATAAYLNQKFGMTEKEVRQETDIMERVLKFDQVFFSDFCGENQWQERSGQQSAPSDLGQWVWPDGLKSIDPGLVVPAPPPC